MKQESYQSVLLIGLQLNNTCSRQFTQKLFTTATSLKQSQNQLQSDHPTHVFLNPENLVKMGQVHFEIIKGDLQID